VESLRNTSLDAEELKGLDKILAIGEIDLHYLGGLFTSHFVPPPPPHKRKKWKTLNSSCFI